MPSGSFRRLSRSLLKASQDRSAVGSMSFIVGTYRPFFFVSVSCFPWLTEREPVGHTTLTVPSKTGLSTTPSCESTPKAVPVAVTSTPLQETVKSPCRTTLQ